jgi:hypothetical protein
MPDQYRVCETKLFRHGFSGLGGWRGGEGLAERLTAFPAGEFQLTLAVKSRLISIDA